jgi:hypothetical protein
MLDFDLAALYEVETKALNQAVKRNADRFPSDFMFRLTTDEWEAIRSQFVTASQNRRNIGITPYAFTEQGVSMLSSVLKSKKAIQVNISIMRVFVAVSNWCQIIQALQKNWRQSITNSSKMYTKHSIT